RCSTEWRPSHPKADPRSARSATSDPNCSSGLCSRGQASPARNCRVSVFYRRRSVTARRRLLGGITAGDIVGSGLHTARGSRLRDRPQRLLGPPGLEVLPWFGGGTDGLFGGESRRRVPRARACPSRFLQAAIVRRSEHRGRRLPRIVRRHERHIIGASAAERARGGTGGDRWCASPHVPALAIGGTARLGPPPIRSVRRRARLSAQCGEYLFLPRS